LQMNSAVNVKSNSVRILRTAKVFSATPDSSKNINLSKKRREKSGYFLQKKWDVRFQ